MRPITTRAKGRFHRPVVLAFVCALPWMGSSAQTVPARVAPPAVSWLRPTAVDPSSDATNFSDADALLASVHARLRLAACWYDGPRLSASLPFVDGHLNAPGARWRSQVTASRVEGDRDALDLVVSFKLLEGGATNAGVAVAFDFTGWSTNNYVLIPASVYNGNRNRIEPRAYASGLDRADLYKKDLPLTTGELPQLSPEPGGRSKVEVLSCNATTSAICLLDRNRKRGFLMFVEQGTRLGDNGLVIEESADRSRATILVSAPGVRERKPEFIGFSDSPDRGATWRAGDELTLRLRIYSFHAPGFGIPSLLEKFMSARKSVTGQNQPRDLIPFSEVVRLMSARIDSRFHEGGDYQFYCPENAAWISFGWVGGLMDTFPMLALGDAARLDRVGRTFDFAMPRAQGRAGYFYGALNHDGKCFGREGYDEMPEIVLTRKNGDVLFWTVKQFLLLKAQGRGNAIKPEWERSMRHLAEAFAATWKRCGEWGNFVNNQTGDVAVYNTTCGASAIGGMALAARYFNEHRFLRVAEAAAEMLYRRDVLGLGMTTGGCADILHNADSETAAGFMSSLMTLYECTGEKRWLEKCRTLAHLTATWVVSYDYQLPPETELARLGARLTGVVWASTQNKHGAPGSCTSSCDALFKLYRATGDRRYADLLRDIVHAHAEGIKPDGQITERLTYCDADSRGSRGDGSTGWCELNGILMAMELPGIYARTDRDRIVVFDHVRARVLSRDRDRRGVELEIHNPTKFDASVSVLIESGDEARKALGWTAFLKWPKIQVKAGETRTTRVRLVCCPLIPCTFAARVFARPQGASEAHTRSGL